MEEVARKITRFGEEMKKFQWILLLKLLEEFGEFGAKSLLNSCKM
jgi:hypothetical protein